MTISVSEKVQAKIYQVIERLQKESPHEPVTQKKVYAELKKPKLSSRHVRRTFRKLCAEKKIKKEDRGQYWLPGYLEMDREYMKKKIKYLENERANLEKKFESLKADAQFEKEFWEDVGRMTSEKIAELQQKLLKQERLYEDILEEKERQEILGEIEKENSHVHKRN